MKKLITLLAFMTLFMGAKAAETTIYTKDYSTATSFTFWNGSPSDVSVSVTDGQLVIVNDKKQEQNYTLQLHIGDGITTVAGNDYRIKIEYKATINHESSGDERAWVGFGNWEHRETNYWVPLTESNDFQTLTLDFYGGDGHPGFQWNATNNFVMWQSGDVVGTIYIKKVEVIEITPVEDTTVYTDIIVNGDMEGTSAACFYITEQGVGGPYLAPILEGVGKDGSKGVKVESYNSPTFDWDTQFFIRLPYQLPAGTKYKVSFDYKATKAGDFDTQAHAEPSQYIHWSCIGSGSFTTAWKTFEKTGTVPSECDGSEHKDDIGNFQYYNIFQSIAFNLGKNKEATKFYFDNIKFEIPEEVATTLTANPAENPKSYPEAITTMAIVGDLTGGWPTNEGDWSMAKPMTQDAEDDAVWTLTINNFTPTKKRYEYKAAANNNWNRYVLPNGDNAYIDFDFDDYPSVKYNLTFTANTKTHNLDLEAVKVFDNMVIVGDFLGLADETANFNPNNGWKMTQSTENPAIWTYTTDFTAAAETYRFKAVGDKSYDYYQLPKEGNTTKQFGTAEYPTGNYELTFTVNTKENSLTLDAVKKADTYTVAGSPALFTSDWDVADANNKLTQNADGTYSITYTNVALTGNVEYKVVKDNDYKYGQWPGSNRVIGISMAGTYDITINFNPADGSVWETMAIAKEITAAGYATYCSPYALNFVDTGVKAYFAKKDGSNVTFYEIFNAPANTGLLLKADKGTYKLKMETVEGEAAANVDGNVLIGVNEQTVVDHSGIFVLLNGDKGVGFYKTTAESFTVGANTAYIDAIAGARSFIGFDDNTTTAIEGVATVKENNGEIYNLQGQRVMKAQKGLYIINGKKVLVK